MSLFGSFNSVTVMGKMTRDPEARTTPNGKRVLGFSLAVNESVKKGDKWEDETTFVDCTAWEKTAEFIERFGGKGKTLLVAGRLRMEKWQDKTSGENRQKLSVIVNSVTFCDGKEPSGDNAGSNQRNQSRGGGRRGAQTYQPKGSGDPADSGGYAQNLDDDGDEEPPF